MSTFDWAMSAVALIGYGIALTRVTKWLRSAPPDWHYAALVCARWAAWLVGVALAYNWPEGDVRVAAALVLALSFDVYARTWKAAERRAGGWQVVGKFGNSVVHARMPADQIEDLRKRIQVIDANGNREV